MAQIIKTHPRDSIYKSSANLARPPGDVTNLIMTPERAAHWCNSLASPIQALKKGTQACAFVVGEPMGRRILREDIEQTEHFKMQVVQREAVNIFYRLAGNFRQADDVERELAAVETGRSWFYTYVLLAQTTKLQDFLNYGSSNRSLDVSRVLAMVSPEEMIKFANKSVHEPTYADLHYALTVMTERARKVQDQEKAIAEMGHWESLFCFITGSNDVSAWKGDILKIKEDCERRRNKLGEHEFRKQAEKLSKGRAQYMKQVRYDELENEGFVVSKKNLTKSLKPSINL